MRCNKYHSSAGFTLIEVITVVAVFAVIIAISVPSVIGFMEYGRQRNRMDTARTLYLAAQNQLTEQRITGTLKTGMASAYYGSGGVLKSSSELWSNPTNVCRALTTGTYLTLTEADLNITNLDDTKDMVHYISKEKGSIDPANPVVALLDPVVLDKEILSNAILIEYNVETGGVLSVFYGDILEDAEEFVYSGADPTDPNDKTHVNVIGRRGMTGGYEHASVRKQGFYGVGSTDILGTELSATFEPIINVYDSHLSGSGGHTLPGDAAHACKNALYAQILMPANQIDREFGLYIDDENVETVSTFDGLPGSLVGALSAYAASGGTVPLLYREDTGIQAGYARIIWVLDYVGGDMTENVAAGGNLDHSIGIKYAGYLSGGAYDAKKNIRVGIEPDGMSTVKSMTVAHPYFLTESESSYSQDIQGKYSVTSARHLHNIRYLLGGKFTQKADIDFVASSDPSYSITNVLPIEDPVTGGTANFTGTYIGTDRVIKNLTIETPSRDDVGLFRAVEKISPSAGTVAPSVIGLTLENPSVKGGKNVGSVCGTLNGLITGIYVSYTNPNGAGRAVEGEENVGGIAGANNGALVDSTFVSPLDSKLTPPTGTETDIVHVKGTDKSTVGGMVGLNGSSAALRRLLFLAFAPEDGGEISPIAGASSDGKNNSNLESLYYLSGTGIRPNNPGYNTGSIKTDTAIPDNMPIGVGLGTYDIYLNPDFNIAGWKKLPPAPVPELTDAEVLDVTNTHYPYPFTNYSESKKAVNPNWPIVEGTGMINKENIAYYEKYNDGTYGFYFQEDMTAYYSAEPLMDDKGGITEAGYVVILDENMTGNNYFFARNVDDDSELENDWELADQIAKMEFKNGDDSEIAGEIARQAGKNNDEIWAFVLPLDKLSEAANQSNPMQIVFSKDQTGKNPKPINVLMQPLFAKGLYLYEKDESGTISKVLDDEIDLSDVMVYEPDEFYIRTPWQMRNISALTGTNNYTAGNVFLQELDLNFGNARGIGISAAKEPEASSYIGDMTESVVSGSFNGEYNGNNKIVSNATVKKAVTESTAGIFAENNSLIYDVNFENCHIEGGEYVGVVAVNNGGVTNVAVSQSLVKGDSYVGTVVGYNSATLEGCLVDTNTEIFGNTYVGGVAGKSIGTVRQTGVQFSRITGNDATVNTVGGVAGSNEGIIEDVLVLSIADISDTTPDNNNYAVTNNGGGIVGENSGDVSFAMYIAPAPKALTGTTTTTMYPIVRTGNPSLQSASGDELCLYLSGNKFSLDKGVTYKKDAAGADVPYNRLSSAAGAEVICDGGGVAVASSAITKGWLNDAYNVDFAMWVQPQYGRYPYPVLKNSADGLERWELPTEWVVTDTFDGPPQLDRNKWFNISPTSDKALNLGFINGEFEEPLVNPGDLSMTYDIAPGAYSNDAAHDAWVKPNYPAEMPSPHPKTDGKMGVEYNYEWVRGWNTRPTNASDKSNALWSGIEFQNTHPKAANRRVKTNYKGLKDGLYAELNAAVAGTLFQICTTKPGTEMYYSFYHAARPTSFKSLQRDKMTFYLSNMKNEGGEWKYVTSPSVIRPCTTARNVTNDTALPPNTAREHVSYGNVSFYDPKTKNTRTAYLYDVWVGDPSGTGYGVSFWLSSSITLPTGAVTDISALSPAAPNQIIGYWDVPKFATGAFSEWKQYYGLYTIPEGQNATEFAFESNNASPTVGNYLDGITFRSPGFLSIDKYGREPGTDTNVKFTKPDDIVTMKFEVKSHGETPVNNIVIKDILSPFTEYIEYVDGTVTVEKEGVPVTGISVDYGTNTAPYSDESDGSTIYGDFDDVLTITLPPAETLSMSERLVISFNIKVRRYLDSDATTQTLKYYFRNQAIVEYKDIGFTGYSGTTKINGSGPEPIRISIDPINVTKTVNSVGSPSPDPLIDGPFEVSVNIKSSLDGTDVIGRVEDIIPKGFVLGADRSGLPAHAVITPYADGSTLIEIGNIHLNDLNKEETYTYTIEYAGDNYGVVYTTDTHSRYWYRYNDTDIVLKIPQPVVGIKLKVQSKNLIASGTGATNFDIISADSLAEKQLSDDNYDVEPEVLLYDKNRVLAPKDSDDNYKINDTDYTAVLIESTNELVFTPKAGTGGREYIFYYQIKLNAEKSGGTPASFDLSSDLIEIKLFVTGG